MFLNVSDHSISVKIMATDWVVGSVVSIHCALSSGIYQGKVSSVNHQNQTITLKQPFLNGIRCPAAEVTFK